MNCCPSDVLNSEDSRFVRFLKITHEFLLCPFFDVGHLEKVFRPCVEVDQFLVEQTIEQFELLHTTLDTGVFPEPTLSSVDLTLFLRNVFRVQCMKTEFCT